MAEAVRVLLLIALLAAALTFAASFFSWWMEEERRLRRALRHILGGLPEAEALSPGMGQAAGLDFDSESIAVLWNGGRSGLVFTFDELEGAELIVDGHVSARVRRGEARRELDDVGAEAERVSLRLLFDDVRQPEFEQDLWSPLIRPVVASPAEAVRLGRRWLSHVEAIIRRPRTDVGASPRSDDEELDDRNDG
ncbi:hypothetical protein Q0812_02185 [Brevundimonas sp. 2R-24]|uniref:Secreted protein n=1 Tax=Peiella sedimenti TaxID=3061083 RepID=A0ABT8SI42_9CAUL|nr:hypothetical protein [Caulobacteraceae bacterium XZ-24]